MPSITAIDSISDRQVAKLRTAGVATTEALLESANTPKRREKLSAETKISESSLLKWVQHADLMRVPGVSGASAALLQAARVTSIKDLRSADAAALAAAVDRANARKKEPLVKRPPSPRVVEKWIAAAKELKPVVRV